MGVAVWLDFTIKNTIPKFENRDIKSSAAKVIHCNFHFLVFDGPCRMQ